jgi:hypothetical protein
MRRLVPFLLGLLVLALAAGCGGSGGTTVAQPLTPERLTQSARASADAESGRFTFALDMQLPGTDQPFAFSGEGAFDAASERASMSLDMSSFADLFGQFFGAFGAKGELPGGFGDPEKWKIEAIQDGLTIYMRFPVLDEQLPDGASWVKIDAGAAAKAQGLDLGELKQFTENDPRDTLDYLRAVAGEIVPVGPEQVRGADTTHYKATIDLLRYEQLVPPAQREKLGATFEQVVQESGLRYVPIDLWVDDGGLVRKLSMNLTVTDPASSQQVEAAMTFELYDYGQPVEIDLPDAAEVVDASTLESG